jgi:hypothetical protein
MQQECLAIQRIRGNSFWVWIWIYLYKSGGGLSTYPALSELLKTTRTRNSTMVVHDTRAGCGRSDDIRIMSWKSESC